MDNGIAVFPSSLYTEVMQKQYIIFGIILLLVAAGAYYYYTQNTAEETTPPVEEEGGLGAELFEQTQAPTDQLPDTNPFDAEAVSPFGEAETNPFKKTNVFDGIFGN